MTSVPKLDGGHPSDNCMTPLYMAAVIVPHLKVAGVKSIWECASGDGRLADYFYDQGFSVAKSDINSGFDFLKIDLPVSDYDAIVTNVPFSKKVEFVKRAYELKTKWAFIMPITIEGELCRMFDRYGMQEITPYQRAHYKTPRQIASGLDYYWICANRVCHKENRVHHETIEPPQLCANCGGGKFKKSKYTAQVKTSWFTHNLNLPHDRIFVDLRNYGYPDFV